MDKPLISYCVFSYNQEPYIRAAVASALQQSYRPLEIIISDDASTDRTFEIIQSMAAGCTGEHTIRINRNDRNLGLIEHVNKLFAMASGELIVLAGGDDVSLPERTSALVDKWLDGGRRLDAVCSAFTEISVDGHEGRICRMSLPADSGGMLTSPKMFWFGCSAAYSRRLYDRFGKINYKTTEDTVFYRRALMSGGVGYVDEPLVRYRIGCGVSTQKNGTSAVRKVRKLGWQVNLARQMLADFQIVDALAAKNELVRWWSEYLKRKELQLAVIEEFSFWPKAMKYFRLLRAFPLLGVRRIVFLFAYLPKTGTSDFTGIDGCFVINLARRTDRWEFFRKQMPHFHAIGVYPERFEAVCGRDVKGFGERPWFRKRLTDARRNSWGGKAGCILSHRAAILEASKRGWRNVLILEDDVEFCGGSSARWEEFLLALKRFSGNWSMVYFYGHHLMMPIRSQHRGSFVDLWQIGGAMSTGAYLLNGTQYHKLLRALPDEGHVWSWTARYKTIDRWFSRSMLLFGPVLFTSSFAVRHLETYSDIVGKAYTADCEKVRRTRCGVCFQAALCARVLENSFALKASFLRLIVKRMIRGL